MEDHVTAKFALGELQLKDIIPLLGEHLMIVMDPYDNWEIPSWERLRLGAVRGASWERLWTVKGKINTRDGETVTEQDPDAPLIVRFAHRPDSQFHTDQKIKIKDNQIIAIDENHKEFKILLVKPANLTQILLQSKAVSS